MEVKRLGITEILRRIWQIRLKSSESVSKQPTQLILAAEIRHIVTHWPILGWNVSKSWLQKVDYFKDYAIVTMQSDNVTFYACRIIKATSGFNLKKQFLSAGGATIQKSAKMFYNYE